MAKERDCALGRHDVATLEEAHDARGIYIGKVCRYCKARTLAKYRPEVLSDPNYEATEAIEPEDY